MSRASVHNISIMEELELGVGDEIEVYKANMIIPQIAENLTRSSKLQDRDSPGQQCKSTVLYQSGMSGKACQSICTLCKP